MLAHTPGVLTSLVKMTKGAAERYSREASEAGRARKRERMGGHGKRSELD